MIKSFLYKNTYFYWLFAILIISEIIVNPLGNFPLNDDWTYGKSEMIFHQTGKIEIGDFPAMTLFTHLVWGSLFTKVFGFSFTVLRFSTLICTCIAMFFLHRLTSSISGNKLFGWLACLTLLFNPIYFNLSNTYMTDVTFDTLLILCVYFAYSFYRTKKILFFFLVYVFALFLVLVRQFGIIVPVCFTVSLFFTEWKRWRYLIFGSVLAAGFFFAFHYYENYLKGIMLPDSAYKFSGNVKVTQPVFWDLFVENWKMRHGQIFLHVFVYLFPLSLPLLIGLLRELKTVWGVISLLLSGIAVLLLFRDEPFPIGNIFINMSVGTETFYESLRAEFKSPHEHTYSETFERVASIAKYLCSSVTLSALLLFGIKIVKGKRVKQIFRPEIFFLISLGLAYIFMILITESYYDRYHLPIITLALIFLSYLSVVNRKTYMSAVLPLLCVFYISVFGTKDYLELNRKRWEAYHYLREEKKIPKQEINGGFEVNCWNEGEFAVWYQYLFLERYKYLIQYRKEPDFKIYKEYPFQRYFPYKKDKIYIFVREDKK